MPKLTDRERLAKIEADQLSLAQEAEAVRRGLRAHYGRLTMELPVEKLSEREFRDVLGQAIRVGGAGALAALKALPAQSEGPAGKRLPAKAGAAPRAKPGVAPPHGPEAGESQAAPQL